MEYIFIYPQSHEHLGLFNDLKSQPHVQCLVTEKKQFRNPLLKITERIFLNGTLNCLINLPGKYHFYQSSQLQKLSEKIVVSPKQYCVAVLDGALLALSIKRLNYLFTRPNVRGVLLMINSLGADSTAIHEIRPLISKVKWDDIYTFDPVEQKKYGWKSIQNAYYSSPAIAEIPNPTVQTGSDIYFIGGLKGGREELILNIFRKMRTAHVKTCFQLMAAGTKRLQRNHSKRGLEFFSGGWKPYSEVLNHVQNTNVILEILQEGQHGPSLRYYEAVYFNKKLLTNNPGIRHLPFYNPAFMKVISSPDEIDLDWVKKREAVDYHYQGEFSPVHLPDVITK